MGRGAATATACVKLQGKRDSTVWLVIRKEWLTLHVAVLVYHNGLRVLRRLSPRCGIRMNLVRTFVLLEKRQLQPIDDDVDAIHHDRETEVRGVCQYDEGGGVGRE